jgi:hypothetical protein
MVGYYRCFSTIYQSHLIGLLGFWWWDRHVVQRRRCLKSRKSPDLRDNIFLSSPERPDPFWRPPIFLTPYGSQTNVIRCVRACVHSSDIWSKLYVSIMISVRENSHSLVIHKTSYFLRPPVDSVKVLNFWTCGLGGKHFTDLMFCWPCIIVYQCSETNVMQFLFSLLRIMCLYMFRALLAHPQEALQKRHLVYCVRVMSVGCTSSTSILVQPIDTIRTQYTKCRLCSASWGWASNSRNM